MDMNIRIWTVRNGDCIVTFPDKSFIYCVSFHPTNNNLVFVCISFFYKFSFFSFSFIYCIIFSILLFY